MSHRKSKSKSGPPNRSRSPVSSGETTSDARQRIIESATELLGREGYGGLSVSAVCKGADVSAPTLYWHFGNKEGLLAAVLKSALRRDADAFLSIDITRMARLESFELYIAALRRIVISDRPNNWVILSALSEARNAAPEILDIIAEARRRQVEYNAEQLRSHWGLRNSDVLVHLWLAYCNYASLLYYDTKSEVLAENAIQSLRAAYFLLIHSLGEAGAEDPALADTLRELGCPPASLSSELRRGGRKSVRTRHPKRPES